MTQLHRKHPKRTLFTVISITGAALAVALLLLLMGFPQTTMAAPRPQTEPPEPDVGIARPGAGSLGDPYYPWMGNTGYDALHYTIDLRVNSLGVPTSTITGSVTLLAEATQALSTFNLDFLGFDIDQIAVNESPAAFSRLDRELIIIPESPLPVGELFTITVAYAGTPAAVPDPALPGFPGVGWLTMDEGIYVLNQPSGASTWFPVNDYPQDKATYTFRITVPDPYVVAANGILEETIDQNGTTTYIWEAADPMASYLTTINIAELEEQTTTGPEGLPIRNYFPIDAPPQITEPFEATSAQIEFFSELLGPYPFEVYGSLVMDANFPAALETQTLPVYGRSIVAVLGERVLAHELAHQWIGNYVSVETWQDIWINEGFATYADWLWVGETQGEAAMNTLIRQAYSGLAPGMPIVRLPQSALVQQLRALPLEGLTLTQNEVAAVLDALFEGAISDDEREDVLADVPEEGLTGEALPDLIADLSLNAVTLTTSGFAEALQIMGLTEVASQVTGDFAAPGRPPLDQLFGQSVYERGGLTFAALHALLGDEIFFEVIRTYVERYGSGTAGTDEFVAVAEEISGEELDEFFTAWLFEDDIPDFPQLGLERDDPSTWRGTGE